MYRCRALAKHNFIPSFINFATSSHVGLAVGLAVGFGGFAVGFGPVPVATSYIDKR